MNNKLPKQLNAVKHGLLAKQVIVNPDESRSFNKLAKRLLIELQPNSVLEMLLAEQIIVNYWRLRKYLKLENELFIFAGEPQFKFSDPRFVVSFTDFVKHNPSFDLLARYNASILRSFYKAIHEYKNIKLAANPHKTEENPDLV